MTLLEENGMYPESNIKDKELQRTENCELNLTKLNKFNELQRNKYKSKIKKQTQPKQKEL